MKELYEINEQNGKKISTANARILTTNVSN
jgi:hypothetical protein